MAFTGGYLFRNFEGAAEPVLRELPTPETVAAPLDGLTDSPYSILVSEGQKVRAGESLLEYGDDALPVPAPAGGTVERVGSGHIVIRTNDAPGFQPVEGHPRAPWLLERPELLDSFRASGCALLFANRFTVPEDFDTVRVVIVNAVHNAPLDQAWTPEIFGDPERFPLGLRTIRALFPGAEITVAINRRNRKSFESPEITESATVRVMSDRYPQEYPRLLIRDILKESGGADTALVVSFEDVLLLAEVLNRGVPCTDRLLLAAGPGVSRPGWYRVPVGTPFTEIRRHLVKSDEHGPWRIIRGNLFTGLSVVSPDAAVSWDDREIMVIREHAVRDFYRFLNPGFDYDSYSRVTVSRYLPLMRRRLDSNVHGGVRPCVQCNFCDEVCPAGLYPHLIWKHVAADMVEQSFRFRPEQCVGCGLCDYVCPSKIDVSAAVRSAGDAARERRNA